MNRTLIKTFLFMGMLTLGFSSTSAQANTARWTCNYTGKWYTKHKKFGGHFTWSVTWVWNTKTSSWKVIGDYEDKFGFSYFDGFCSNNKKGRYCDLYQLYKTGKLKGKRYRWYAKYKDLKYFNDRFGRRRTLNKFKGSWYYGGKYHGRWFSKAICTKTQ